MSLRRWWLKTWGSRGPARRLRTISGDTLPSRLPFRDLVLATEDDEDWCVGMRCPCGCGQVIELLLIAEAKPRWDLKLNRAGRPSLSPSVWLKSGCKSHFWLRDGYIKWCS